MRKSKFTEEQIASIVTQAQAGVPVDRSRRRCSCVPSGLRLSEGGPAWRRAGVLTSFGTPFKACYVGFSGVFALPPDARGEAASSCGFGMQSCLRD